MTSNKGKRQVSVSEQIPNYIKRVSRSLGYAQWLGGSDDWFGLSLILRALLAPEDRAALAMMALRSLDEEHAHLVIDVTTGLEVIA